MTTISVTAEHIARGEPESCEGCPVALAIRDVFPGLAYVVVGPEGIAILPTLEEEKVHLDPPRSVQEFIWNFDDDACSVNPFTFDLDYPAVTA